MVRSAVFSIKINSCAMIDWNVLETCTILIIWSMQTLCIKNDSWTPVPSTPHQALSQTYLSRKFASPNHGITDRQLPMSVSNSLDYGYIHLTHSFQLYFILHPECIIYAKHGAFLIVDCSCWFSKRVFIRFISPRRCLPVWWYFIC